MKGSQLFFSRGGVRLTIILAAALLVGASLWGPLGISAGPRAAGETGAGEVSAQDDNESSAQDTSSGPMIFVLTTSNRLLSFNQNRPGLIRSAVPVTNLRAGERLLGIDFRPANGQLYGLGSTSQIYTIDVDTGAATPVGAQFTPALEGTEFGFDFNPVPDRIRIVGNTGQNLRVNPDTGQVQNVDGRLAYDDGDFFAGELPRVIGAAYTNPDADPATGTTLNVIDSNLDILNTQNPPNNGTLKSVGSLRVDTLDLVGFDITDGDQGFAALRPRGGNLSVLYSVDLSSGRVRRLGMIGGFEFIRGLAIPIS